MSAHSKHLGRETQILAAIESGFEDAGITSDNIDNMTNEFLAYYADAGSAVIIEAAKRFALQRLTESGKVTYLDADTFFITDETIVIKVDYDITVESIATDMRLDREWKYVGTVPVRGVRSVKLAIGRLNKSWTEESVAEMLAKPDCPLKGSGAWVWDAYLKFRPKYDGKSSLAFPHAVTSRWQCLMDNRIAFPVAWVGGPIRAYTPLVGVKDVWGASRRLCLIIE